MMRKFNFVLIAIFLAVQAFAVMHMAEHGFEKHEHHGQLCSAFLYNQQSGSTDLPAVAALPVPTVVEAQHPLQVVTYIPQYGTISAWPRAPPILSLI